MRDRAKELIHLRKMIFFCRLIFQMGFSAGKLCSGEQGGEGSREKEDTIQLGISSSMVSSNFLLCTDIGNITPLQPLLRTQGTLQSSTVQETCSLSVKERILPVLYLEEHEWDFPLFHSKI